ncbi:MAG: flagellar biosynthesis protein FlhB [Synergistaceae bacterium]|jgi:flagellar biosynthetic protein FlhB|nr:flagellar biosynthesis protein FlhB [Synergistaceae bacterium]
MDRVRSRKRRLLALKPERFEFGGGAVTGHIFDLQFFAQERTESATPKKRQKVRSEGKVCKSMDLTAAAEILVGLFGLLILGPSIISGLLGYLRGTIAFIGEDALLRDGWFYRLEDAAVRSYFEAWLLLGLIIAVFVVAVTVRQVGWSITFEPFKFNLGRLNPVSGMKKIISMRSRVELTKGILKASIFVLIIWIALKDKLPTAVRAMQLPMEYGAMQLWDLLWDLAMRLGIMLLIMGGVDYLYQKWDFEKSIKMSKQEIKEEYKQMEGDPQIKNKIRQKQRELAKKRMMSSVPKADVVITNPTTLAVALAYNRKMMAAPQIVAKGKGVIAQKIREIAEAHGVPIVENKPLAWALYEGVEIGEEVPEDLYRGVAEILAMVYRLKKKPSVVV